MMNEKKIIATDLEDFDEVDVIEVLVKAGDKIEINQSLLTLESDKAMMEIPATEAGIVKSVAVAVGDKVKQGDPLVTLNIDSEESADVTTVEAEPEENIAIEQKKKKANKPTSTDNTVKRIENDKAYASPAIRKYASELGVKLEDVVGSGSKGRIIKEDVKKYVQSRVSVAATRTNTSEYNLPDFSKFGDTEEKNLNKLKQVSAQHLHHAWSDAPHVTQFDDADITELEKVRKELKPTIAEQGAKLTLLPFIMKALVKCLQEYPDFNSSINHDVTALIRKKYYNIGVAVDTPRGLVVPVIKEVDKKKIPQLATELMQVSTLARVNKLTTKYMQGGCMTITSLGGIGGKHFTPIINYPEVAILGVSRSQIKLVKNNADIEERLMLPLSLSYDHRAIDGVAAVKFIMALKNRLGDVWSLMV